MGARGRRIATGGVRPHLDYARPICRASTGRATPRRLDAYVAFPRNLSAAETLNKKPHGRLPGVRRENRPAVAGLLMRVRHGFGSANYSAPLSNGTGEGSRPTTGEIFS